MTNPQHLAVLQALAARSPHFQGDLRGAAGVRANKIAYVADELEALELITITPTPGHRLKWHAITAAGLAALQAAPHSAKDAAAKERTEIYSVALPRTHANLHQTYQPTQWPIRQGAEQHRSCPSRGFV